MNLEEKAFQEALDFLEYRSKIMSRPFVACGEKLALRLAEYYSNMGVPNRIEILPDGNYKFSLTNV